MKEQIERYLKQKTRELYNVLALKTLYKDLLEQKFPQSTIDSILGGYATTISSHEIPDELYDLICADKNFNKEVAAISGKPYSEDLAFKIISGDYEPQTTKFGNVRDALEFLTAQKNKVTQEVKVE